MKPTLTLLYFSLLVLSWFSSPAHGMQDLSPTQMKNATGQAGISIGLKDVKLESRATSHTFANPDNPLQYLRLDDLHWALTLSNSRSDQDGDELIGGMTIDLMTRNDQAYFFLDSKDMELSKDITIGTVNVCGTDIGSAGIDALSMPTFHLALGAHECGIDMELGARIAIEELRFGTDATDTLALSGITLAESFSQNPSDTLTDPSTWQATGEFTLGDITNDNPVTLDITADTTDAWTMTDTGGNSYSVPNPRAGSGFIALNMPFKGSIRVDAIKFGDQNFGAFALDNIQAHKLLIEIPGRGLGAP